MIVWAEQSGYNNAIVKGTDTPRKDHQGWRVPDIPRGGEIYISALAQAGWFDQTGMQAAPLAYAEIKAAFGWTNAADRQLIRDMSAAYVRGLRMTDPLMIAPMELSEAKHG